MYSDTVRRLVAELPNQGRLTDSLSARVDNPVCGDIIEIHLELKDGIVERARFQASGCPAAIASAAAITIMVEGQSRDGALSVGIDQLLEYLEGLPEHKRHGAEMAVRAVRQALGE